MALAEPETANPLRAGLRRSRVPAPCAVVIFGATGDLARRKLLPALYNLHADRLLPGSFAIVGASRRGFAGGELEGWLRESVEGHSRRPLDAALWDDLRSRISHVEGAYDAPADFERLARHLGDVDRRLGTGGNRLFYLATPPSAFASIVGGLGAAGLARPGEGGTFARVVVEKPFGHDLESALALNRQIHAVFDERSVFRIDHYLGKETVQNLLVFRFANAIFEPIWNQVFVDSVQITVAESLGVGTRGRYFEEAGIVRDMLQNHVLQLVCLTAMEPPASLAPDAVRDEKVKVLRSVRPLTPETARAHTLRAQYAAGSIEGEPVAGYRDEPDVAEDSRIGTYVAHRLQIDNWRWGGVPFYVRAGKRLPKRVTEIALQFRSVPHRLFVPGLDDRVLPNTLAMRIQPEEGIALRFDAKVPGPRPQIEPVAMDFRYGTAWGKEPPEAYERLLLDAMLGDGTLFIRADEVEEAWRYVDPIIEGLVQTPPAATALLPKVRSARITGGPVPCAYLAGWLASRLGWGPDVQIVIERDPSLGPERVGGVRIDLEGGQVAIERDPADETVVHLLTRIPDACCLPRAGRLFPADELTLLHGELQRDARDPLFEGALARAAELCGG